MTFRPHPVMCESPACSVCRPQTDGPCFCSAPFLTACGRRMRDGKPVLDEHGRPKKVEPIIYTYNRDRVGCRDCLKELA